jgi:asparagine synthetase B (glutamine-hydrolysing)
MVSLLELNPEAIPRHFLFRYVPGKMTYFSNIHKILCGHIAKFWRNELYIEQLESFDDWIPEERISKVSSAVVNSFDTEAERIIGSYVHQIQDSGHDLLVLLSGGVYSSLLTSYIQANLPPQDILLSSSYTIEAQEFDAEIGYAQHSSNVFETTHKFLSVLSKDYVSLMEHFIDLLAQPFANEQDPCYLALAKSFSGREPRYLFSGSVADTLFGYGSIKRLLQVERYGRIPLSRHGLDFLGRILENVLPNKAFGLRETAFIINSLKDPLSPHHPNSREGIFTNLERVNRCFGAETISKAINYRLTEFEAFSSSQNIPERTHLIGLTQGVHNDESFLVQVFRSYDLEIVTPYIDSEFVRLTLAFDPKIRYFARGRQKWLPKALLEKRLSNGHQITQKPKRAGGFDNELRKWMKSGILRDVVHDIQRPGYMTLSDFEKTIEEPDWFTWNLLTLDLFQKRILKV